MTCLLVAIVLLAVSGMPGLLFSRRSAAWQWIAVVLVTIGSGVGLFAALRFLATGGRIAERLDYSLGLSNVAVSLPIDDIFHVAIDELSALFLLTIFFVPLCGSIYGLGYWPQRDYPKNGRKLRLFYGLLSAGMALLVIARHSILFLFGWEVMALSAYFLVTTEDDNSEVREVGWIYLVATHTATLVLFGLFGLLRGITGGFVFGAPLPADLATLPATLVFLTALVGFGLKAGVMPLHVWLPGAHAMAPSHVSALMSGVIIKMGVYGLVRTLSMFPQAPPWWGGVILVLGVASGLLGIAYSLAQQDLKRLLAYSSVENIGVIFIGLGLSLLGRAYDRPDLALLGMAGALLHVLNHGLFKSLLFFAAGAVIHQVHTRRMDQLGGLAKRMPLTAFCFLFGAAATCALPPTNGFISEFLIYIGLVPGALGEHGTFAAMAAPALASIGALAVAAFVGAYGTVFLGVARTRHVEHAREAPLTMIAPMAAVGLVCLSIGLAPNMVLPMLQQAAIVASPGLALEKASLVDLFPTGALPQVLWILTSLLVFGALMLRHRMTQMPVGRTVTWGCGYSAPTSRMQYTPSSFSQMLVNLFGWALRPKTRMPVIRDLFPSQASFESEVRDVVLDQMILPAANRSGDALAWFRWLQQGSSQLYLAYVFVTLVLLFLWR